MQLFLRQGAASAAAGILVGLGVAWGLTRLFSSLLSEVSAADPVAYFLAAALLFAATLPARKAARIDPLEVLRAD